MRILMILLTFNFFSSLVFANQPVVGVVGVGYEEIENNPVKYDSQLIKGETRSWVLSTPIYDLIHYNGQKYERINNKADYASAPPNTKISFGYWFLNNTESEIQIYSADFFHSRTNLEFGDITRLGSDGQYSSYGRKNSFISLNKVLQPYTNPMGGILYEFTTIQPIRIKSYSTETRFDKDKRYIDYKLVIENISEYELCHIQVINTLPSGTVFNDTLCLTPKSEKIIKYSDDITDLNTKEIILEGVTIKDPNHHIETITSKLNDINDENSEGSAMIFSSNYGSTLSLGDVEQGLTVELLPYWIQGDNIKASLDKRPDLTPVPSSTKNSQPKYSFTIVNNIKKEKVQTEKPVNTDVLGVTDKSNGIEKKSYIIWYILGTIFLVICVWFLSRLW